jgi:signal transduction histidine kinase/CheY-like chemotaxis protein
MAVPAVAGAYAALGGAVALAGWVLDLPRLAAWDGSGITMKANAALCALLAGSALVALAVVPGRLRRLVQVVGLVVSSIGGLTLLEHLTGVDLGIDTFLFDEAPGALSTAAPGRMGPPASTSFLIVGICLLLAVRGPRARRMASGLALVPIVIAALAMTGYLYSASQLYAVARFTGIALQTATMIAALGIGLTVSVPEHGLVAALRRDDPGGVIFRHLLAPLTIFPVVVGAVRLLGERAGYFDMPFGTAARTLVEIIVFVGLVWWTAEKISRHARVAGQAEQALREADRRKDEFLATLAHELRNPLAPLRNGLELIRRTPDDAAATGRAHAAMERQLAQLVHLVDDLLDISRISRGAIELRKDRVDVSAVIQSATETSRPVIDALGHELVIDQPSERLVVEGDMTRLTQVVANLLNNAAKYTDHGGRIRVRVERAGGDVLVRVRDNGVGIPPDLRPRLFDMFARSAQFSHRSRGGLGIGLALVKRLVEMHGGSVAVHSPPAEADDGGPGTAGRGSEFIVRLPLVEPGSREVAVKAEAESRAAVTPAPAPPPPVAVAVAAQTGAEAGPARLRVLIADDNIDSMETLAMLVDDMGHETRTAQDGKEAVEMATAFRPDIALLDIGMPELSGYEVAERIRAEPWGKTVVLVALTGWGRPEDRSRSREAGFDQHLVKPANPDVLEQLLAKVRQDLATGSRARDV